MSLLRLRSAEPPFTAVGVAGQAAHLLALLEALALWEPTDVVETLDADIFGEALRWASEGGDVMTTARVELAAYMEKGPEELSRWIAQLRAVIEESPVPDTELPKLDHLFGTERLAELCGVANSSLRRYLSRDRPVPDDVALRLHTVARIVGALAGSYNDRGVRRWFDRPRVELGQRTPASVLSGNWQADEAGPLRVLDLAETTTA